GIHQGARGGDQGVRGRREGVGTRLGSRGRQERRQERRQGPLEGRHEGRAFRDRAQGSTGSLAPRRWQGALSTYPAFSIGQCPPSPADETPVSGSPDRRSRQRQPTLRTRGAVSARPTAPSCGIWQFVPSTMWVRPARRIWYENWSGKRDSNPRPRPWQG